MSVVVHQRRGVKVDDGGWKYAIPHCAIMIHENIRVNGREI